MPQLIKADILVSKLKNPTVKIFLEKHTRQAVPNKSIHQKNYVEIIYNEILSKIRDVIEIGPIWISVDETTNVDGSYIASAILRKLRSKPSKQFLINCGELNKCNHQMVTRFFNDTMGLLWLQAVKYENVLLFLTDAALYMLKTGNILTTFYPKMLHLTCVHTKFHRVAKTVRVQFSLVFN